VTIDRSAAAAARQSARRASQLTFKFDPGLPISARRLEILEALRAHPVLIVAGDTGSGKSTQLPQYCLEIGRGIDGLIAHTQPRRIAARALAARIAEELSQPIGATVGFRVRFADQLSDSTRLVLMTDGLLLAELTADPWLRRYDTVIVDEAHERSLNVDLLLGVLKRVLPQRPDLKLIVTSATLVAPSQATTPTPERLMTLMSEFTLPQTTAPALTYVDVTGGPFTPGETVRGQKSRGAGVVLYQDAGIDTSGVLAFTPNSVKGGFLRGETIVGGTSSATATVVIPATLASNPLPTKLSGLYARTLSLVLGAPVVSQPITLV